MEKKSVLTVMYGSMLIEMGIVTYHFMKTMLFTLGLRENHTLAPHAEGKIFKTSYYDTGIPRTIYLRRHANRWNMLPDIQVEE